MDESQTRLEHSMETSLCNIKEEIAHESDDARESYDKRENSQPPSSSLSGREHVSNDVEHESRAEKSAPDLIDAKELTTTSDELLSLRHIVESKSDILASAWSELNNVLGDYKAQLFSVNYFPHKYEGITEIGQLKNSLIDRDNAIRMKDMEIERKNNEILELHEQLNHFQHQHEQFQLDISVKDSLLKKYQEDLLQKESLLITSNTKVSRLENRLRGMEMRAGSQASDRDSGAPPRKLMRPPVMTVGRLAASAMPTRVMASGAVNRMVHSPMTRIGANMTGRATHSTNFTRRRFPAATTQVARLPVTKTRNSNEVVCIEVEDDDEIKAIENATQSLPSGSGTISVSDGASLYVESWPEQTDEGSSETDTTGLHSLPGSSMDQQPYPISASLTSAADMNQPLMMSDSQHHDDTLGQDDMMEGTWPVQLSQNNLNASPMRQSNQTPNKSFGATAFSSLQCPYCQRIFTQKGHRNTHVDVVHLGIKKFPCPRCGHRFGKRQDRRTHMIVVHGEDYLEDRPVKFSG